MNDVLLKQCLRSDTVFCGHVLNKAVAVKVNKLSNTCTEYELDIEQSLSNGI